MLVSFVECLFICFFIFTIVYNSSLTFVAVVIRFLIDILFLFNCIMYLNGGPIEKQRQLKSQSSLKIFNNNNNNGPGPSKLLCGNTLRYRFSPMKWQVLRGWLTLYTPLSFILNLVECMFSPGYYIRSP